MSELAAEPAVRLVREPVTKPAVRLVARSRVRPEAEPEARLAEPVRSVDSARSR